MDHGSWSKEVEWTRKHKMTYIITNGWTHKHWYHTRYWLTPHHPFFWTEIKIKWYRSQNESLDGDCLYIFIVKYELKFGFNSLDKRTGGGWPHSVRFHQRVTTVSDSNIDSIRSSAARRTVSASKKDGEKSTLNMDKCTNHKVTVYTDICSEATYRRSLFLVGLSRINFLETTDMNAVFQLQWDLLYFGDGDCRWEYRICFLWVNILRAVQPFIFPREGRCVALPKWFCCCSVHMIDEITSEKQFGGLEMGVLACQLTGH